MKITAALALCAMLAACASAPSLRQPDGQRRIAINHTVPPEIQNGVVP